MVDLIPDGISKGAMIEKLIADGSLKRETLVCAGDYYNDAEMIKSAGIGVCPANSPDDIKALADLVLCNPEDGLIAAIIEHLEKISN
jgi:hydroxymethylpyrimidine pyrophosphatase-like HAD family hydrolase